MPPQNTIVSLRLISGIPLTHFGNIGVYSYLCFGLLTLSCRLVIYLLVFLHCSEEFFTYKSGASITLEEIRRGWGAARPSCIIR